MKKEDSKDKFFAAMTSLLWFKYKKRCKHCGKFNTYRMKKINVNFDFPAFVRASFSAIEHMEKRYVEIVESRKK